MANFFTNKIKKIHKSFPQGQSHFVDEKATNVTPFTELNEISEEDLRKIVMSCKTKSCSLDPIPTALLKKCLDPLLPGLQAIVNLSLQNGIYPEAFKVASVTPILKKQGLDIKNLSNYRPVSNLAFIGKVVEKVVVSQLEKHLH